MYMADLFFMTPRGAVLARRVVVPSGCPQSQGLLEEEGVTCVTVDMDEIAKGAGGIGCLTGVLRREGA